jgi:predicted  nucleic acid-binding Zn-ribbon protein
MALIRSDDLDRYEQLRKKAHGVAVTTVNNRSCFACGAILTAAHYQAARSPNQITLCETCGRILFA